MMNVLTISYVISLCISLCNTAVLYDHSAASEVVLIEDIKHNWFVTDPIIFKGVPYTSYYVSSNGMVTFDPTFHGFSWPLTANWIAPFGYSFTSGYLKVQNIIDPSSPHITRTNTLVNDVYPDALFLATQVSVLTWLNVKNISPEENSFQLVLATDTLSSYAIFVYEKIEWINAEVIGISSGDPDHHYKLCNLDKPWMLYLTLKSNFQCSATPGVIVLRIDIPSWTQDFPCINLHTPIKCFPSSGASSRCPDSV